MVSSEQFHEVGRSVNRRVQAIKETAEAFEMSELSQKLSATRSRGRMGKTLIKAGVALIAVPDPITDIPGGALVVAGVAISKFKDCVGIQDLKEEVVKTFSNLRI
jgi:hypothetical protein